MSTSVRNKEIKVQRAAQSLDHFKNKVAGSEDVYVGILKPALIVAGILVVGLLAWAGIANMRSKAVERHEAALAEVLRHVEGSGATPASAVEVEMRMREKLPVLETLARTAPSSQRKVTEGHLASWKLMLGPASSNSTEVEPGDPWQRIRLAQRSIALSRGEDAARLLAPLRKDATPQEAWGRLNWTVLMDCNRLQANRDQALKDLAEYKQRFKDQAEANGLDAVVKGI